MTHLAAKKINLEDLWPELEAGISTMVTNLNQGFPYKKWIELYTHERRLVSSGYRELSGFNEQERGL